MKQSPISEMIQVYAEGAIVLAKKNYSKELDFSEKSIEEVEEILSDIHSSLPKGLKGKFFGLSDEKKWTMAKGFGAYVGEIIRLKTSGQWDIPVPVPHASLWKMTIKNTTIFPIAKVYKRITNGPDENVDTYIKIILKKNS